MTLHFPDRTRERILRRHVPNGMRYADMTRKQSALCALLRPVRYWGYLHHRLRLWWVLPGDRFTDMMRAYDYVVLEVRHDYVVVTVWPRVMAGHDAPYFTQRYRRPLPFEWWPQ